MSCATAIASGSMRPPRCRSRRSCATVAAACSSRSCSRAWHAGAHPRCRARARRSMRRNYRWVQQRDADAGATARALSVSWQVERLPPGFQHDRERAPDAAGGPAEHLVFSDGLASVSVFVESAAAPTAEPAGARGCRDARRLLGLLDGGAGLPRHGGRRSAARDGARHRTGDPHPGSGPSAAERGCARPVRRPRPRCPARRSFAAGRAIDRPGRHWPRRRRHWRRRYRP